MDFKNNLYRSKILVLTFLTLTTSVVKAQLYINNSKLFIDSTSILFVKQQDVVSNYSVVGKGTLYLNGSASQNINMNGNTIPNLKVANPANGNIVSTCQVGNITLEPSTLVNVNNQLLKISNSIINNSGAIDVTNGSLELNGTSAQSIAGSFFLNKSVKNLKLSNSDGISLSGTNDTLKISGVLDFGASNVTLSTNGNLTIASTASNTACVADMTSNGSYSGNKILGNTTIERYIPNHTKAWQLLAVPTSGQTIRQAWQENASTPNENLHAGYGTQLTSNISGATSLGFDAYTSGGPSIKSYNATNSTWDGIASTNNNIANVKGYMVFVRGDRSITGIGQSATATIMRSTGSLYQQVGNAPAIINVVSNKFECVSNPYASAIDFSKITRAGGVQNLFYVWDPKLTTGPNSAYGYGGYQTFTANGNGTYHITPAGGSFLTNDIVGNIQSGSAFFISASGSNGTLEFAENNKVVSSALVTRPPIGMSERLEIKLSSFDTTSSVLLDGIMFDFDSTYSNNIDMLDAVKIYSSEENIAIQTGNKTLVVERRNELKAGDTLFFNLNRLKQKSYQFDIFPSYINSIGLEGILVDKYLHANTIVDLITPSTIIFSVTTDTQSFASDRFYMIFKQSMVVPVKIINIDALRNEDKTATVNWETANEINLNHYVVERSEDAVAFIEVGQQQPISNNGLGFQYYFNDLNAKTSVNYYRIKALSNDGQIQYSKIVKVDPINSGGYYLIYPNPIADHSININFNNSLLGSYEITVWNTLGKLLLQKKYILSLSNETIKIGLPASVTSGNYLLKIIQPDGRISSEKILVIKK